MLAVTESFLSTKQQQQSRDFLANGPVVFHDHLAAMNAKVNRTFEDVEPESMLFAKIIRQAHVDSMPEIMFDKHSCVPLFNSDVPDAYDGYDFMSSTRMDLYSHMINQDPAVLRYEWNKIYQSWKKNVGSLVAQNIFDHTVRLLLISKTNNANYLDAYSFLSSPQFKYWCNIANVSSTMQKERIFKAVNANLPATVPQRPKHASAY